MKLVRHKVLFFGTTLVIAALVLGSLSSIVGVKAQSVNLLTNPGFEAGASQSPSGWTESGSTSALKVTQVVLIQEHIRGHSGGTPLTQ